MNKSSHQDGKVTEEEYTCEWNFKIVCYDCNREAEQSNRGGFFHGEFTWQCPQCKKLLAVRKGECSVECPPSPDDGSRTEGER